MLRFLSYNFIKVFFPADWVDSKHEISTFAGNHRAKRGSVVTFPIYHITQTLGATQFEWITSKKIRHLHETTEAMGSMRSLSHLYTQITPLENWATQFVVWITSK